MFIYEDFNEQDFFAKARGRKGYKELVGGSKEYIENPTYVIYDILNTELGLGRQSVIGDTEWSDAIAENGSVKTAFSLNEYEQSNKVIEEIVQNSKLIIKYNESGTITLGTLKKWYDDSDIDMTITVSDVSKYSYKKTKIEEVYNQIKVDYNKSYASDNFQSTTGLYIDPETGDDLYPVVIDGVLKRESFFGGYTGEIYSYDEFTNQMYGNMNKPEYIYDINHYNLIKQESKFNFESNYVRDLTSSSEIQKTLMLWHCNQHLIIKANLPLKYIGLEVGDIVRFDQLIDNKLGFGEDYTDRYIKNGQVIYPYFLITSTDKDTSEVKIECIQLHRMDWGVDGHAFGINDDRTYNSLGQPAESGVDDDTAFMNHSPSSLYFFDVAGEEKSVIINNAYANISSVQITEGSEWVEHSLTTGGAQTGNWEVRFKTLSTNQIEEEREATGVITFENGDSITMPMTQQFDTWDVSEGTGWNTGSHPLTTDHTISVWNEEHIFLHPTLQNEDGNVDWNPNTAYGLVTFVLMDDQVDNLQAIYDKFEEFGTNHYESSVGLTMATSDYSDDSWNNHYDYSMAEIHSLLQPWETNGGFYVMMGAVVVADRHYRNYDGEFTVNFEGVEKSFGGNYDWFGTSTGDAWLIDRNTHFWLTIWKPEVLSTALSSRTKDDAIAVLQCTQLAHFGEDPHYDPGEDFEDTGYGSGDTNADEVVNVLDVVATVLHILSGEPNTTELLKAMDIDSDGIINILDVVTMTNFILAGGYGYTLIPSWHPEEYNLGG